MDDKPADLSDVDSINNLDTARMTLRWALERLRLLEKTRGELEKNTKDLDSLRAAFSVHLEGDRQKDLYYRRMEEIFSSLAQGLDPAQLKKRQEDLEAVKRRISASQPHLEEEIGLRRGDIAASIGSQLEADFSAVHKTLEDQILSQAQERDLQAARKREDDFSARNTELRKREIHLDSRERSLDERQSSLEAEHQERRQRQEEELARVKKQALEESRSRIAEWEKDRSAQEAELVKGWALERDSLLQKSKTWEGLSRGYLYHIMELQEQLLRTEIETLQRMQAVEASFNASSRELRQRKDLLAQEGAERERAIEEERTRMLDAMHQWRSGLEAALAERSAKLEAAALKNWERWTEQEKERSQRDQASREHQRGIEAKSRQIEELRRCLTETIEEYRRRAEGSPPAEEKGETQ